MSMPLIMVSKGTRSAQNSRTKSRMIPDNAPAIQNTLCLLEAVIAANQHHHIQVSNPVSGSSQLARAREILKGMLIVATLSPAFRFCDRCVGIVYRFIVL
jgi:hypothetical protein